MKLLGIRPTATSAAGAVALIRTTAKQVRDVARFAPATRDWRAPRMEKASTVQGALGALGGNLDVRV